MLKKPSTTDEIVQSLRHELKQGCYAISRHVGWIGVFSEQEYEILSGKEKQQYKEQHEIGNLWIQTWLDDVKDYKKAIQDPNNYIPVFVMLFNRLNFEPIGSNALTQKACDILVEQFYAEIVQDDEYKVFENITPRIRDVFWNAMINNNLEKTKEWSKALANIWSGDIFSAIRAIRNIHCPLTLATDIPFYKEYWIQWFQHEPELHSRLHMGSFLVDNAKYTKELEIILNAIPKINSQALNAFLNEESYENLREAVALLENNTNVRACIWECLVREYTKSPKEANDIIRLINPDAKAYIEHLYLKMFNQPMPWDSIQEQIRIQNALNIEVPLLATINKHIPTTDLHIESIQ